MNTNTEILSAVGPKKLEVPVNIPLLAVADSPLVLQPEFRADNSTGLLAALKAAREILDRHVQPRVDELAKAGGIVLPVDMIYLQRFFVLVKALADWTDLIQACGGSQQRMQEIMNVIRQRELQAAAEAQQREQAGLDNSERPRIITP